MTVKHLSDDLTVARRKQLAQVSTNRYILVIVAAILCSCPVALEAFGIVDKAVYRFSSLKSAERRWGHSPTTKLAWVPTPTHLFQSDGNDEYVTPPREEANLVNQKRYLNSIETLQRLVAKAKGETYQPPENPPVYVIGRFEVPLRIDTAPGLDLTETEFEEDAEQSSSSSSDGGLVLVTSVTGNAADAGLQPLDTIVGVSCKYTDPPFQVNVNSQSLQTTAIALQTAVAHALSHNSTEIHLEMNRLIAGHYNPQQSQASTS